MLTKTFAMLNGWKPGQPAPDPSFDAAEIAELGTMLRRLVYAPAELREKLQERGVTLVPANFYSEVPLLSDVRTSFSNGNAPVYDCCFDPDIMRRNLDELQAYSGEFDPPVTAEPGSFSWKGGQFSYSDAMAYYCMLRRVKPKTVFEIGSGWSTLVADMALRVNGGGRIICIEPYPTDFLRAIPSVVEVLEKKAQDVSVDYFNAVLCDGDVLFIDSTHTVKHGSDCLHIYLQVMPRLLRHLTIHAHDIYLPGTMPLEHFLVHNLSWTEQYLLYAYLLNNPRITTLYGSRWHMLHNRENLDAFMHGRFAAGGASFWFEQTAPAG
jgi:hypothetical protein